MSNALMNAYARLPVTIERGAGAWLYDTDGRRYLDLLTGIAACTLGHAHPGVAAAIRTQAEQRLLHVSNWVHIPAQRKLAAKLAALSGMDRVFLANSGAEANEAALKLARLHGRARAIGKPKVVVAHGAFHGRTLATLAASANPRARAGFEPLPDDFLWAPFDDLDAIRHLASRRDDIAAILVEPIQGEGGVRVPRDGYLRGLREICDRHGWLLMLDEIQTGIGRTGAWFAHQSSGIVPDVMTLAKALGNGVPIGACLASGEAAGLFRPGMHGSTFGGNPLACASALAVLAAFEDDDLIARARDIGEQFGAGLRARLGGHPRVMEIRGRGLIWGVKLDRPCTELTTRALAQGLLVNVTGGQVLRLLPPVILSDAEVELALDHVVALVEAFQPTSADRRDMRKTPCLTNT